MRSYFEVLGTVTSTLKKINKCQLLLYGHRSEPGLGLLLPTSGARGREVSSGTGHREQRLIRKSGWDALCPHAFIHSFIHSFDRYLLSTYSVLGTGASAWEKTKSLSSWSLHSSIGSKIINRK